MTASLAFFLVSSSVALAQDAEAARPNVVVILVDDLGWMDVNCNYKGVHGSDGWHETPRIDALAAQGVRLTDGYAACQVCSPTRVALQTGRYPARGGYTDYFRPMKEKKGPITPETLQKEVARLREQPPMIKHRQQPIIVPRVPSFLETEEVTIAEVLREAGYATCHLGKWHLGPLPDFGPEAQGYDVNIGGEVVGTPPSYYEPFKNSWITLPNLPERQKGEYLTDRLGDEAAAYIRRHVEENPRQPFFMHFAPYAVHGPIKPNRRLPLMRCMARSNRTGVGLPIMSKSRYRKVAPITT